MKRLLLTISTVAVMALPAAAHAETGEAEAMTAAVGHAASAGLTGPLQIQSSGRVSLARSQAVLQPGASTPAPTAVGYPFVLSSTDGSTFQANVPTPRGSHLPPQRYLAITISESWLEETFSPNPIPLTALGTIVTVNLSSTQATSATKGSCQVDGLLVNALERRHLRARLASARHSLKACEARHR